MSDVLVRMKKCEFPELASAGDHVTVADAIAEIERLTRERDEARRCLETNRQMLNAAIVERDNLEHDVERHITIVEAMYAAAEKYNAHTPGADWSADLPMRMVDEILSLRTERDEARDAVKFIETDAIAEMKRLRAAIEGAAIYLNGGNLEGVSRELNRALEKNDG